MSRLFDLIDAYRVKQGGMSESAFARKAGIPKNTLNGWRNRGMVRLPDGEHPRAIADALGQDYDRVVLPAVLIDLGWLDPDAPPPAPDHSRRSETA